MITLYCWSSGQRVGLLLNPEMLQTHADALRKSSDVYWIDLDQPTPEEESLVLEQFFCVHRLTRTELMQRREANAQPSFPKVEAFADYLFVVINPLARAFLDRLQHPEGSIAGANGAVVTQLNAVLTDRLLITHHTEHLESVEMLRDFLSKHEEQAGRGPDYLFHLILDAMIDSYAPVLDRLHVELEAIEDQVLIQPTPGLMQQLVQLKRLVILLRKTMIYERELLVRLSRGDFAQIEAREIAYYRFVYDHVVRFTELIEGAREMIGDLMQLHLAATSNKMNEIMKVLAMISTTLLPMTVIAGIYGMNFENLPEIKWEWGYPMALGMMLLTGVVALGFFRWRRWF